MNSMNHFLFGLYPYIAFAIFLLGCLIRYDRDQYTWKTGSSQMLESKQLKIGSRLFHIGVIMILIGHFVGLLTPHQVWDFLGVSAAFKQKVAMGAGGLFGIICFAGLTILIKRRLTNPRVRANTSKMDLTILFLLYAQLILGLISIFVSMGHLDGSEMLKLMHWAQQLVIFNGTEAASSIANVHIIFKLHIVLGMTLFVVFPFSRLVHIWSVPVKYVRRSYQIVRSKG
ncbi:respiratory nitrate reductase subunit gamma [Pleionea sediminis]|uniref:respiratory nitrate reductase subunit gamma n=1 Tax=Pleionea sediminis TaxID=2569479 RepID=UPI001184F970|nr:respiratory nitrate reductase subunit gamma [Pleionea sediminis]